jgi:EAL domain-containing protein (putative c-di-GMP-specific phosphodiesterase class I)
MAGTRHRDAGSAVAQQGRSRARALPGAAEVWSFARYLPFAELKIDPSFVQNCSGNKGNARICKSMIQFAQNFERSATAVGIETIEDAQTIMGLGCNVGQGYIFGKPMTDQQLLTMVRAGREKCDSFVSA